VNSFVGAPLLVHAKDVQEKAIRAIIRSVFISSPFDQVSVVAL